MSGLSPEAVLLFAGLVFMATMLETSNGDVICRPDGTCAHKDSPSAADLATTVCENCKSCVFENCCHRRYTSPFVRCEIPGWRAPNYNGLIKVGRSRKRDGRCFSDHDCPSNVLSACVKDHPSNARGYCVISEGPLPHPGTPIREQESTFALIVAGIALIGGWFEV